MYLLLMSTGADDEDDERRKYTSQDKHREQREHLAAPRKMLQYIIVKVKQRQAC